MATFYEEPIEVTARAMIYAIMQSDLESSSDKLGENLAKYLYKKYGYDPRGWSKEDH